ncbi:MAG TPA: CpaF family protein [Polyangiaceae bacterium]|nr:CpaF family protein [Polyangiaceae bacterium]
MIDREIFEETLLEFLAPVAPYLRDPAVSEVMINGPGQIFVERRGLLEPTPDRFESEDDVLCALRNLAQFVNKPLDELHPTLEARLPDGSRVQAVIPPIASSGPYVSIRRFQPSTLTAGHLIELGSVSRDALALLESCVRAKLNIMVAGGTGSGKTSLLNLLATFIPPGERVIVIEDSKEVQLQHGHVIGLEARPADVHGRGAVSIRDLFRTTLRMRPDRIVIGEVRGGEALDLVQAMVSGHGGCLGTLHATYPRDTLTRFETMALMSDLQLPLGALRLQIGSGIQLLVQIAREQDGSRGITHITEVLGYDLGAGQYQLRDLFVREYHGIDPSGRMRSQLLPTGALPSFLPTLQKSGAVLPPGMLAAARAAQA